MVTRLRLTGCLNCRWLPSCATKRNSSFSIIFGMSLYFMCKHRIAVRGYSCFCLERSTND
jgi:hypothetical protein